MSAIYFMGAEPADFIPYGTLDFDTISRTGYSRGGLKVGPGGGSVLLTNHFYGTFTEATDAFFFSARVSSFGPDSGDNTRPFVIFRSGTDMVLGLGWAKESGAMTVLEINPDTLAARIVYQCPQPNSFLNGGKLDYHIELTTGRIRAWANGVPMFDQTLLTGNFVGRTVDGLSLCSQNGTANGFDTFHQEVMVAAFDLRSYRLATLAPVADAAPQEWTGSFTDINDAAWQASNTAITTNATDKTATFKTNTLPVGNFSVAGLKLAGVFETGSTGPNTVKFATDDGTGHVHLTPSHAVETGPTWVRQYLEENPETGNAWTDDEISNMKIGVKSGM